MIAKTSDEIEHLRAAGNMLSEVLRDVASLVAPGVTTAALDIAAEQGIRSRGGVPAFLNYKPSGAAFPYPAVLCVSVNDEVVHGIPSEGKVLQKGDILSLDLGLSYRGFYVDSAVSVCVGASDKKTQRFFDAIREALSAGISAVRPGGHVGDIGAAVEAVAHRYGYSVVEELGGHATGKAVHERPFIPNVGTQGAGEKLREGLVIAIEPIFSEGNSIITLDSDQWTYRTKDGSRAGHFEQTLIVTKEGCEILTPF